MTANILEITVADNSAQGRQRIEYQLEFDNHFSKKFPTLDALNNQFDIGIDIKFPIFGRTIIKTIRPENQK